MNRIFFTQSICMDRTRTAGALAVAAMMALGASVQGVTISDNFNRPADNALGTLSDGVHTWTEVEPNDPPNDNNVRLFDGQEAITSYQSGFNGGNVGAGVEGDTILNGQVELTVQSSFQGGSDYRRFNGISYRAASADDAADYFDGTGYYVAVRNEFSTSGDVVLFVNDGSGSSVVGEANIGGQNGMISRPFTIRAEFDGLRHQIFYDDGSGDHVEDGNPVIDVTDSTITSAGHVGMGNHFEQIIVDDFSASGVIPEPASLALLGLGGLALLGRRRRRT